MLRFLGTYIMENSFISPEASSAFLLYLSIALGTFLFQISHQKLLQILRYIQNSERKGVQDPFLNLSSIFKFLLKLSECNCSHCLQVSPFSSHIRTMVEVSPLYMVTQIIFLLNFSILQVILKHYITIQSFNRNSLVSLDTQLFNILLKNILASVLIQPQYVKHCIMDSQRNYIHNYYNSLEIQLFKLFYIYRHKVYFKVFIIINICFCFITEVILQS